MKFINPQFRSVEIRESTETRDVDSHSSRSRRGEGMKAWGQVGHQGEGNEGEKTEHEEVGDC